VAVAGEPNRALAASNSGGVQMSKEKPTDDPRQQTDWGSHKQTDKPWKGNLEKEQRSGGPKPEWRPCSARNVARRDGAA